MLAPSDRITLNRERLLQDAKAQATTLPKLATPLRSRAPGAGSWNGGAGGT